MTTQSRVRALVAVAAAVAVLAAGCTAAGPDGPGRMMFATDRTSIQVSGASPTRTILNFSNLLNNVTGSRVKVLSIRLVYPPAGVFQAKAASKQNLRKRLRQHHTRTAAASTLRRTLGCLLAEDLGLQIQHVGSSGRRTNFGEGEQKLSDWMAHHALVSWMVREHP
jgi:hypothetical protein